MLRPNSGGQTRQAAANADAPALRFLRRACAICQEYDEQGDTFVRNDDYRQILRDLEVPKDSQEESFLRRHLEAASTGYFSYLPMLRALGVGADIAPPMQPPAQTAAAPMPERGQQGRGAPPSPPSKGSYNEPTAPPRREAELEREARYRAPSPEAEGSFCDTASVSSTVDLLEDEEKFWNKRGPAIQTLFQQWDCQGLSNESFMSQLQALLGSRVDITSPESDFVKLTNKHRVARNMKFASLTVALRQDARRTAQQRAGYAASSCAVSERDMSEVGGSDSMAAGKPSRNLLADIDVAGRRRAVIGPDTYARGDAEAWRRSTSHWPPKDGDDGASEASYASRSSLVSMADSAREEFIQRGRGHGNILTWGSDSRALTPEQKRRGRAMVTDPASGAARGYKKSEVIN